MWATCGCSGEAPAKVTSLSSTAHHHHDDHHHHDGEDQHHVHHKHEEASPSTSRTIRLEQDLRAKNNRLAERNRGWLEAKGIVAWNLVSSPGTGKTTLLERTIRNPGDEIALSGDRR
jgi:hydrogenase nickel incorporation protein HypB